MKNAGLLVNFGWLEQTRGPDLPLAHEVVLNVTPVSPRLKHDGRVGFWINHTSVTVINVELNDARATQLPHQLRIGNRKVICHNAIGARFFDDEAKLVVDPVCHAAAGYALRHSRTISPTGAGTVARS